MTSAVNRIPAASIITQSFSDQVAEELRRVTVQIFGSAGYRGAGVVWSGDGLIVTNTHVVNGNSMVRLYDGRTRRAELVRKDRNADLALLRIPLAGIESASLRDSRSLRTGEMVVAVGHPMGETGAVSLGIVHAPSPGATIEADIRLAPGNSGGPLADAREHVVGINCMVANGIGIAISTAAIDRFLQGNSVAWERAR